MICIDHNETKVKRVDLYNGFLIYFKRSRFGIYPANTNKLEDGFNKWLNKHFLKVLAVIIY